MQTLPPTAVLAGREVLFVVATHLRREPGNVIAPAGQDLAYNGINALTHIPADLGTYSEPDRLHRFSLSGQHHAIVQQCPAAGQSLFRLSPRQFWMIVLRREMRQHY